MAGARGDFCLTAAQEARIRAVPNATRQAAEVAADRADGRADL